MKNILKIVLCALVLSASKCENEIPTVLPPETQTGANTLGCLVNGKLFVAQRGYGYFGEPRLYAWYSKYDNSLEILSSGKNGRLTLYCLNIEENVNKDLYNVHYKNWANNLSYSGYMVDGISITRLDTINKIISGTFSCTLRINDQSYNGNDTIMSISQGRFDINNVNIHD